MTQAALTPVPLKARIAGWVAQQRAKIVLPPAWRFVSIGLTLAGARTFWFYALAGLLALGAWGANGLSKRYLEEADRLTAQADQSGQKTREKAKTAREREAAVKLAAKLAAEGFTAPPERLDMAERLTALSSEWAQSDFSFEIGPEVESPIPSGEGANLVRSEITLQFKSRDPLFVAGLPARLAVADGPLLLLDAASISVDKSALAALDRGGDTAAVWPLRAELRFAWVSGRILAPKPESQGIGGASNPAMTMPSAPAGGQGPKT